MTSRRLALGLTLALGACRQDATAPGPKPAPKAAPGPAHAAAPATARQPIAASPRDAGPAAAAADQARDGGPAYHLDDTTVDYEVPRRPDRPHDGRTIELTLRSSPPGALALVDGARIGTTPTYWSGEADQRPHDFTFVLDGYVTARYRFVPTTSGVVHGSLERLKQNPDDAGP